jgi:imidazolonepropionase-like amidohydrolase
MSRPANLAELPGGRGRQPQPPVRVRLSTWLLVLAAGSTPGLWAHDQIPGAPQRQPIVIRGATIHPIDRPLIESGSVLLEDGRITAVGQAVAVPEQAVEIDGTGQHVYPGLIESMSDIGLREISAIEATDDRAESGDRNPNVRVWDAINPDSELIPVARAGGVLVAMTGPGGNGLRGQTAVIQLDGWTVEEMVLLAPAGLYVDGAALFPRHDEESKRREAREQRLADLDALLDEARRYGQGRQQRAERTPSDVRLESLLPVIAGQLPIIVQADLQGEIESAVSYARARSLRLVIYGGYDAEACAELLRRYEIPVIIASIYRLPLRRDDPYDSAYTLPERLRRAGVRFAIAGEGTGTPGGAANVRNLPYHAACAVAYGLPRDEALRSITLSAAEILGISDRIGSITVGKDATLIIADGDILETESHVTAAFIQGRAVDLGSRHKTLYEKYKLKYSRR